MTALKLNSPPEPPFFLKSIQDEYPQYPSLPWHNVLLGRQSAVPSLYIRRRVSFRGTTTIPSFSGHIRLPVYAIHGVECVMCELVLHLWHKLKKLYNETQLDLQIWYLDFVYEFLGTEKQP